MRESPSGPFVPELVSKGSIYAILFPGPLATITVDSGVITTVPLTSGFGDSRFFDASRSALVLPWAGNYMLMVSGTFASNATGYRQTYLTILGGASSTVETKGAVNGVSTSMKSVTNWGVPSGLEPGYLQPSYRHNAGVSLNLSSIRVVVWWLGEQLVF